jgi:hypothetical protein
MVDDYNCETVFPWRLVEEIVKICNRKGCEFKTYADYPVKLNISILDKVAYINEFLFFKARAKNLDQKLISILAFIAGSTLTKFKFNGFDWANPKPKRINSKGAPVVILSHDADHQPYKTLDMMEFEKRLGVVSSAFFFYEQNLKGAGYDPYTLDLEKLKSLERAGFEIGYHLNAYELANYNLDKAFEIINRDVAWFEQHFKLRSFVPHGGIPGYKNLNNDNIPYQNILRKYTWCYNGLGQGRDLMWTDGYCRYAQVIDPREVAEAIQPGDRAVFLMHPQYFGDRLILDPTTMPISQQLWWQKIWNLNGYL